MFFFFFFNATATTEIYTYLHTLSLHDALPIWHIFLEMSDDGRVIDPDRRRARAITMGLMSPAETDSLSDAAAQALIFEPGLSTATTVTAISGRGVGLDVVRNNLERIGDGKGTRLNSRH